MVIKVNICDVPAAVEKILDAVMRDEGEPFHFNSPSQASGKFGNHGGD